MNTGFCYVSALLPVLSFIWIGKNSQPDLCTHRDHIVGERGTRAR